MNTDATTIKNRSYWLDSNSRRDHGRKVVVTEDAYYHAPITKGTRGTIRRVFHAGFNGIAARVELADGRMVTLSGGLLTPQGR